MRDDRLLAQQLQDRLLLGLDFNVEVTGFEMADIDLRIASLQDPPETAETPAYLVPRSGEPAAQQNRGLWVRPPSLVMRQCPPSRGLRHVDERGARRDDLY
jgi:hypothetical protein